jgi:alkylation response protein AidB-like acyl-CoA dehydrogenase
VYELVCRLAEEHAAAGAAAGRLSGDVVEAMQAGGLFKLYLPASLGGLGLALADATAVIARVSEADPAAGWAVMIGAGPNWFAGHMPPPLAADVYSGAVSCVAGSGKVGHAVPDGDGWRVSGRWRWCSGAPWATWFTFNAAVDGADPFTFAVPAADVIMHPDTWDVRGLRATASWDVELHDVPVPVDRTFRVDEDHPTRAEPVFGVPFMAFAQATMAAVSVGATRRAVRLFAGLAARKAPSAAAGPGSLAEDRVVADHYARAVAAAQAAADHLERATTALSAELPLAAAHAAATGVAVARTLWDLSGMTVLAQDDPLGRTLMDLQAAAQNAVVAPARFADIGASLLRPSV